MSVMLKEEIMAVKTRIVTLARQHESVVQNS